MSDVLEKFHFQHLIEDEKINVSELPNDITEDIKSFDLQKNTYVAKPDAGKLKLLRQMDVKISDNIHLWIEQKEAEEKAAEEEKKKKKEEEETKKREDFKAKGKVSESELKKILGKSSLGSEEEYMGFRLRRKLPFLGGVFYEII